MSARWTPALASLGLLAACTPPYEAIPASGPTGCPGPLADVLTAAELTRHMDALADIGDAHATTRVAGSPGFDGSVDYVALRLAEAGMSVRREPFLFDDFVLLAEPALAQVAPAPLVFVPGDDFQAATFSGAGDVEGPVIAVDLSLGAANHSSSGCELDDFAGFFPNSIALLQRGTCYHQTKIANAVAAGAAAVIYFNQGDTEERSPLFVPRLPKGTTIPVVSLPYARGQEFAAAAAAGLRMRVVVSGHAVVRETVNVIAETPRTASGQVIMLGAHLDSVAAGPGINDNGSGVAALLGLAAALQPCDLQHQVRLAFWGAEEYGLLGSSFYVDQLSPAERDRIALYINLDMIASPNPVPFIYDGDGSAFQKAGPAGSAAIEAALFAWFEGQGVPTSETAFDGRSDYWAFINHDIPAGGLFTGAEDRKNKAEAQLFGGEADLAYDPCYHAACDDRDNYDADALLLNTRAAAHVTEQFAMTDPPLPPPPTAMMTPRAGHTRHPGPACDDLL